MIIDNMKNIQRYQEIEDFHAMLKKMSEYSTKHEIEVIQALPINKLTFAAKTESEAVYENHKKNIDIHFILAGEERISLADATTLSELRPYDENKDIMFLEGEAQVTLVLRPGDFLICYPQEAHKVGVRANSETKEITKLVGKISVV